MNEHELRQERAKALTEAKRLLDKAEDEGRDLTLTEERQFNELMGESNFLSRKIGENTPVVWTPDECRQAYADLDKSLGTIVGGKEQPMQDNYLTRDTLGYASPEVRAALSLAKTAEYRAAFWRTIRQPQYADPEDLRMLNRPEVRALTAGTDTAGGYLLPESFERKIVQKLAQENVIRALATVLPLQSDHNIPVETSTGSASWIVEGGSFPESDPSFGKRVLRAYKAGEIVKVSEELLFDAGFDLEDYLAGLFARNIGTLEEAGFCNGDGVNKPSGFLVNSELGVTSASASTIVADEIIELYHSLRRPYRARAVWVMNDSTAMVIRKLKTGDGQYIWQTGLQAGQPDRLLGRPVVISDGMPTIAASAKVIAFGDLSYYWVADRQGRVLQVLRELYASTGHVGFKIYQRVDGILALDEAIKLLQMAS